MLAAQGGANIIYGAGMLEMGMTFDLAQLLIDAEIFKMVLHTINGFEVNEETIALGITKKIGVGGEFISNPHTSKNYKSIQSHSSLFNRQTVEDWTMSGSPRIEEAAYEKAKWILENHVPDPLTEEAAATIRKIIEDAEVEYGLK